MKIISQNKDFIIDTENMEALTMNTEHTEIAGCGTKKLYILGKYKTVERTEEVFAELVALDTKYSHMTYEMPEE